ncbi:MAG TPA: type I 3-dehydroquinate dehydratase [Blastocatellia bacterium]|nr:type I 3-dehydroquinate dehydratase [Blastocatellia bacterium]
MSVRQAGGNPSNKVAATLAMPGTDECLLALGQLRPVISMAEIRLDLMDSFDLERLVSDSPCPLIITCRPAREGGRFGGGESERLDVLKRAMDLGCDYVDIEWDSVDALLKLKSGKTRLIASRHWYDRMPASLLGEYAKLRDRVDVVKLVGMANRPAEMFPAFELLRHADGPVIAIAMGEAGRLTRILAPCFESCFVTYAAPSAEYVSAPGQLTVSEMVEVFNLNAAGTHTAVHIHLCSGPDPAGAAGEIDSYGGSGDALRVRLVVTADESRDIAERLRASIPGLVLTADAAISAEAF